MDQQEQNDPVWDLLKQARMIEPSPFFARNIAREVRRIESQPRSLADRLGAWLSVRIAIPAIALVALCAAAIVLLQQRPPGEPPTIAYDGAESFDPASEIVAVEYFGQLMAVADPGTLSDEAIADLFY